MNDFKKIVTELLKPRTLFTLMFFGTACWLIVNQLPVPEFLKNICISLLSFYYGQKVGREVAKVVNQKEV